MKFEISKSLLSARLQTIGKAIIKKPEIAEIIERFGFIGLIKKHGSVLRDELTSNKFISFDEFKNQYQTEDITDEYLFNLYLTTTVILFWKHNSASEINYRQSSDKKAYLNQLYQLILSKENIKYIRYLESIEEAEDIGLFKEKYQRFSEWLTQLIQNGKDDHLGTQQEETKSTKYSTKRYNILNIKILENLYHILVDRRIIILNGFTNEAFISAVENGDFSTIKKGFYNQSCCHTTIEIIYKRTYVDKPRNWREDVCKSVKCTSAACHKDFQQQMDGKKYEGLYQEVKKLEKDVA